MRSRDLREEIYEEPRPDQTIDELVVKLFGMCTAEVCVFLQNEEITLNLPFLDYSDIKLT